MSICPFSFSCIFVADGTKNGQQGEDSLEVEPLVCRLRLTLLVPLFARQERIPQPYQLQDNWYFHARIFVEWSRSHGRCTHRYSLILPYPSPPVKRFPHDSPHFHPHGTSIYPNFPKNDTKMNFFEKICDFGLDKPINKLSIILTVDYMRVHVRKKKKAETPGKRPECENRTNRKT